MKCKCGSENTYPCYRYKNIKRIRCLHCGRTYQMTRDKETKEVEVVEITPSKLFKPAIYKD